MGDDDRAASEVIGAVLIFGFLVITFAVYQGVIIPEQNRAAEFEHNQEAQKSIQELRNAIRQTAGTASEQSVSITLGATYPQRVLGINPGVSAGSIRTEDLGPISIQNISAVDPEVADYFGSNTTMLGTFESKTVVYYPVYTHYTERPLSSYENTLAFNHFPNGVNLSITDQAMIDGEKITLIALGGNVSSAQQDTVTVDTKAVSTATNSVSVTNASGPINITIASRLSADDWESLLESELTPEGHVLDVKQSGTSQVSIILEGDVTYELRMARVGVGSGTPPEDPKYLVDVSGDDTSVIENGTQQLVVEARDRFNNPVSNVTVDASIELSAGSGETVSPDEARTKPDGRATFTYAAPEDVDGAQHAEIQATFDGDGTANQTITFQVKVLDADGSSGGDDGEGGGSDEINPSSETESLVWVNATVPTGGGSIATIYFENTDESNPATIDAIRYQFYSVDSQGGGGATPDPPRSLEFNDPNNAVNLLDPFLELNPDVTYAAGETRSVAVTFYEEEDRGGSQFTAEAGDFFIVSMRYTIDGTERRATYFIGLTNE